MHGPLVLWALFVTHALFARYGSGTDRNELLPSRTCGTTPFLYPVSREVGTDLASQELLGEQAFAEKATANNAALSHYRER